MKFHRITALSELKPGKYGILEPDNTDICEPEQGLMIMPGLAFDKNGFRLGYGGGYYDRYIDGFIGKTIGITFHECYTDRLPAFETDKTVNSVITEKDL